MKLYPFRFVGRVSGGQLVQMARFGLFNSRALRSVGMNNCNTVSGLCVAVFGTNTYIDIATCCSRPGSMPVCTLMSVSMYCIANPSPSPFAHARRIHDYTDSRACVRAETNYERVIVRARNRNVIEWQWFRIFRRWTRIDGD